MVKNRMVRFLVTEEQFRKLKGIASRKGYSTLSSYIRDAALDKHIAQEEMIVKIYKQVVKDGE